MNFAGPVIGVAMASVFMGGFGLIAPVTVGMSAMVEAQDHAQVTMRVTGRKIKACSYVPDSSVGWYRVDGVWRETAFDFPDDPSPNSTRPSGWQRQDFGLWRWSDLPSEYDAVRMTNMNLCGDRLEVTTNGPFQVE